MRSHEFRARLWSYGTDVPGRGIAGHQNLAPPPLGPLLPRHVESDPARRFRRKMDRQIVRSYLDPCDMIFDKVRFRERVSKRPHCLSAVDLSKRCREAG